MAAESIESERTPRCARFKQHIPLVGFVCEVMVKSGGRGGRIYKIRTIVSS